jgi:excisionase family DNA binding protein
VGVATAKSLDDYPDILTAALVAEMLGMNLDYVRKLSREGTIPAHKMPQGRAFRYMKDEVVAWLRGLPAHDQTGDRTTADEAS